jgi:hypothetical protein
MTSDVRDVVEGKLDRCIAARHHVTINFWMHDVCDAFNDLTEPVMVGKIEIGRRYKGHLITTGEIGTHGDPAIFDRGEI